MPTDIICSKKQTVSFEETIMRKDKYLNIFSCQVNTILTKEIKNSKLFLLSTHYCENVNIVFIILWIFFARHQSFKDWEYTWIFSNFSWGTFSHVMHFDQLCTRTQKYSMNFIMRYSVSDG